MRSFLADLDWQEVGPWQWFHAGQQATLNWNQPEQTPGAHWLRESRRRAEYHTWSVADKIAAQFAGHVPYTAKGAVRVHEKGTKGPPTAFVPCWQVLVSVKRIRVFRSFAYVLGVRMPDCQLGASGMGMSSTCCGKAS